jgi:putative ABC transport system permease protein
MSLLRLTVKNASRAPVRSLITVAAVAITLVAFVLLRTLSAGWTDRIEQTPNNRVITRNRIGWARSIPVRYTDIIRHLPGVRQATAATFPPLRLPGDETARFLVSAVDAQDFVNMHYELTAPVERKQAFVANRRGALVGEELASERGWHLGQQLHFQNPGLPGQEWTLELEGIVKSVRVGFGQRAVWFHWDYYNETLPPEQRDLIDLVAAEIEDPRQGARLAKDIDIRFDTENDQTFSQEDKALNTAIVGRFGAMLGAMNVVSLLVLGVVVLILGNTIALSTRERVREFGTLRAIGFLPLHLVAFVLGEAAVLGLAGGGLGVALAYPLVQGPLSSYLEQEMRVAPLRVATADALGSLLLGVLLGLIAAGLPALRAGRLRVTESLSHVN